VEAGEGGSDATPRNRRAGIARHMPPPARTTSSDLRRTAAGMGIGDGLGRAFSSPTCTMRIERLSLLHADRPIRMPKKSHALLRFHERSQRRNRTKNTQCPRKSALGSARMRPNHRFGGYRPFGAGGPLATSAHGEPMTCRPPLDQFMTSS